jgi:hypothetical protein
MSKRKFIKTDKKGREETWEWEETPEAVEAIKKLNGDTRKVTEEDTLETYTLGDK